MFQYILSLLQNFESGNALDENYSNYLNYNLSRLLLITLVLINPLFYLFSSK